MSWRRTREGLEPVEPDVVGSIRVPAGVNGEAGDEELVRDGQGVDEERVLTPGWGASAIKLFCP